MEELMGRPRNWYDMTDEQRRDWQRQDSAREEAEDNERRANETAEQARRDARRAEESAKAARYDREEQAGSFREEIEELEEALVKVRLERDGLIAACEALLATGVGGDGPPRVVERWDAAVLLAEAAIRKAREGS